MNCWPLRSRRNSPPWRMTDDIRIRAYQPGDEHGLAALFGRCFGTEISAAHWLWKLKSVTASYENVWVVTAGEQHVGQYVGVPVDAWVNGTIRPAIVILDTMVDPTMRRRGILTRMGQHAHDNWRRAGVHFGIGLPNQQWGSRAAAIGWLQLFPFPWLMRVIRPESILARRLGLAGLSRLTAAGAAWRGLTGRNSSDPEIVVQELQEPHPDLDVIADSGTDRSVLTLVRGAAWVEQRYLSCPSTDYQVILARRARVPVGYAVYRVRRNGFARVIVTELITSANDATAFDALVGEIERRSLASGAEAILTLSAAGTVDYRRWRRGGYFPRKHAFTLQFVPLQPEMREMRDVHDWHFMGGDFDVV